MQEIKFRGKCMCSDEWVYGDLIHKRHDRDALMIQDENGLGNDVVPESVGQFTGLHDKNGKEIYEGDVIRGNCGNGEVRHLISFYDMIASFVAEMLPDNDISDYCSLSQIWILKYNKEVIGNIHDNPNLLTDGND